MKLFLSLLIFLSTALTLLASPGINLTGQTFQSVSNGVKETGSSSYEELINALKISPKGSHALYLAIIYLNGIDSPDDKGNIVKKDIKQAKIYFNKAIDLGYYNAAQILGSAYVYNKDMKDYPDSVKKAIFYLKLALSHDLYDASTVLADIYINKLDNLEEGLKYLEVGAKHNVATSQLMLAIVYKSGVSSPSVKIDPNDLKADIMLNKACENPNKTEKVVEFCSQYRIKKNEKKPSY